MRLLLAVVLAAALAAGCDRAPAPTSSGATVLTGPDGRFDVVLEPSRP
jgi:hypothetical protein